MDKERMAELEKIEAHGAENGWVAPMTAEDTFVFLGYSLNDNNLNLIIGWINYFRELHGIEARPANFWIDSKPSTPFEQARLENRNISTVSVCVNSGCSKIQVIYVFLTQCFRFAQKNLVFS